MKRNIKLFYIYTALKAGIFTVPIWIVFQSEFLTFTEQAFFASMVQITTVVLELPTGVLADLLGKKKSLILGVIFISLGFVLLGMFPGMSMMWVFALSTGLGGALASGADRALLYDSLVDLGQEDEYAKISANVGASFQIIAAIAIASGGYLYQINASLPYYARGVFFLFAIPVIMLMKEPFTDTEKFTFTNYIKQTVVGAKEAFHNKYVAKISVLYFLVGGFSASAQRFFVQPFMVESGVGDIDRGWIASIVKVFLVVIMIGLTRNKKVFKSRYFIMVLPIVMVISFSIVSSFNIPWMIIPLIGINLPAGARSVFLGAPLNKNIRSKYRATANSFVNMLVMGVYALSSFFGGLFADKYSIREYFYFLGAFSLVVLVPLSVNIIRDMKVRPNLKQA